MLKPDTEHWVETPAQEGVRCKENPHGDIRTANLLHLLDMLREHPERVAYADWQLIRIYERRGVNFGN